MEKNLTIKQAYLLSWKYLYPNSIERRNVKLALKFFDRSTIAALESLESTNSGFNKLQDTVIFIKLILKFWNIVNTKSTTKGQKKLLDEAKPITSVDDQRFELLMKLSEWLQAWKQYSTCNKTGFISVEAYYCSATYRYNTH